MCIHITGLAQFALLVLVLGASSTSCASAANPPPASTPLEKPKWVERLIAGIESEPPTNPPSSIWQYRYRGALVYFRPERCCDIPSELFDENGVLICRPSGGFSGQGDGKCADFTEQRTGEMLIWRDGRAG